MLNDVKNANDWRIFGSDDSTIETLDVDQEDIDSLHNLDIINTIRYGKHVKNCAL